jgi:hypothetical protein
MPKWIKPRLDTKFHIDFDWWEQKGLNFRIHLLSHLCDDCRGAYSSHQQTELVDWIDPDTAEVTRVDGLWHSLRTCCSNKPGYISESTPLTTAVFRVFLANGNEPLSPEELHERLGFRTPQTILRAIGGLKVYNGIKPVTRTRRTPRARLNVN